MNPQVISAPRIPLYQAGWLAGIPTRPVLRQTIGAPRTPLYQLGWLGFPAQQVVGAGASVASTIPGAVAASSVAGPIVAGVVAIVGVLAGLMAAHNLRAKQAKDENSAMNIGVSGFDSDLRTVQAAFNSGQISASDATTAVNTLWQNYWALVTPHIQPGRNGCNGGGSCPSSAPSNYCSGNIGAACCVGCADLSPSIQNVLAVLQAGGGVAQILQVFGSKYGGNARGAYTLTFTPPPAPALPAAIASSPTLTSLVSAVESPLTTLTSALTTGSGGSSLMPLLLLAGAAWFFLR